MRSCPMPTSGARGTNSRRRRRRRPWAAGSRATARSCARRRALRTARASRAPSERAPRPSSRRPRRPCRTHSWSFEYGRSVRLICVDVDVRAHDRRLEQLDRLLRRARDELADGAIADHPLQRERGRHGRRGGGPLRGGLGSLLMRALVIVHSVRTLPHPAPQGKPGGAAEREAAWMTLDEPRRSRRTCSRPAHTPRCPCTWRARKRPAGSPIGSVRIRSVPSSST